MGILSSVFKIGGSILGGSKARKAATKASQFQVEGTERAIEEVTSRAAVGRADQAPFRETGEQALFKLADLAGVPRPVTSRQGVRIDPATGREIDTLTNQPVPEPKTAEPVAVVPVAPPAPVLSRKDARKKAKLESKLARQPEAPSKKRAKLESKLARFLPAPANVSPPVAAEAADTRTQLTPGTVGFEGSPGFQFRLQQGVEAIDNAAGASGLLRSGRRLKGLTEFGQNIASSEFTSEFNRLAAIAGLGQTATARTALVDANAANTNARLLTDIGAAKAAGVLGRNSAFQSTLSGVSQGLGDLFEGLGAP